MSDDLEQRIEQTLSDLTPGLRNRAALRGLIGMLPGLEQALFGPGDALDAERAALHRTATLQMLQKIDQDIDRLLRVTGAQGGLSDETEGALHVETGPLRTAVRRDGSFEVHLPDLMLTNPTSRPQSLTIRMDLLDHAKGASYGATMSGEDERFAVAPWAHHRTPIAFFWSSQAVALNGGDDYFRNLDVRLVFHDHISRVRSWYPVGAWVIPGDPAPYAAKLLGKR